MRIEIDDPRMIGESTGIEVGIKDFKSNPNDPDDTPTQVYIEFYEGKVQVHVWDGELQGPYTIKIDPIGAAQTNVESKAVGRPRSRAAEEGDHEKDQAVDGG